MRSLLTKPEKNSYKLQKKHLDLPQLAFRMRRQSRLPKARQPLPAQSRVPPEKRSKICEHHVSGSETRPRTGKSHLQKKNSKNKETLVVLNRRCRAPSHNVILGDCFLCAIREEAQDPIQAFPRCLGWLLGDLVAMLLGSQDLMNKNPWDVAPGLLGYFGIQVMDSYASTVLAEFIRPTIATVANPHPTHHSPNLVE